MCCSRVRGNMGAVHHNILARTLRVSGVVEGGQSGRYVQTNGSDEGNENLTRL